MEFITASESESVHDGQPVKEDDLVRWILTEGHDLPTTARFVNALCWRLVGRGVPLWRVTLYAGTLHPQIRSFGWRWWRDRRLTEELRVAQGIERTEDYARSPLRGTTEQGIPLRRRLDADSDEFPLLTELRAQGGTDYLVAPLYRLAQRIPVVAWATDRPGGFSDADLAALEEIRPALAVLIESSVVRRTARRLFAIYHGDPVGTRVLDGQILRGVVEELRAVVMATDLRGFTTISDRLPGQLVIRVLDDYFEHVTAAVHGAGGTVLKFIGDGVLAIFRADPGTEEAAARSGLAAAREIDRRLAAYNATHGDTVSVELRAGIGLHLGDVLYGNVGAPDRLDFTAIGPAVNLAFRLEGLTKELGRPILASREFADAVGAPLDPLGPHPIRGLAEPVEVFGVP